MPSAQSELDHRIYIILAIPGLEQIEFAVSSAEWADRLAVSDLMAKALDQAS